MDRWAEPLIMESAESLGKILAGAFPFLVHAAQALSAGRYQSRMTSVPRADRPDHPAVYLRHHRILILAQLPLFAFLAAMSLNPLPTPR
jgi:hypothetical protein